jgi:hypothetical protein
MREWVREHAPNLKARTAGLLYFLAGEAFSFADKIIQSGKWAGSGNAAAAAQSILANPAHYRLAIAAEIFQAIPLYALVTWLLYEMLKPVDRGISLLAAVFSWMGCLIMALDGLLHLAPLILLTDAGMAALLPGNTAQALALLALKVSAKGTILCMICFGCYCFGIGSLVLRARFMPRIIGAFLMLAGSAYLYHFFAMIIAPVFEARFDPQIYIIPGIAGEGSLILWLSIMGINSKRWREQAAAPSRPADSVAAGIKLTVH